MQSQKVIHVGGWIILVEYMGGTSRHESRRGLDSIIIIHHSGLLEIGMKYI